MVVVVVPPVVQFYPMCGVWGTVPYGRISTQGGGGKILPVRVGTRRLPPCCCTRITK